MSKLEKEIMEVAVGVILAVGLFSIIAIWLHHPKPPPPREDPRVERLRAQIAFDSAARVLHEGMVRDLQTKIDSLTEAEKRFRVLPLRRLDSVAHVAPVYHDTTACVDTATYRRLVLSSLNTGEGKYMLCLGELAQKDSILALETHARIMAVTLSESEHVENEHLKFKLETETPHRLPWFMAGALTAVAASAALYFTLHH